MVAWRAAGSAGLAAPKYDEIRRQRDPKPPAAMIRPARIPTSARPAAATFGGLKSKENQGQLPASSQASPAPSATTKPGQVQRAARQAAFSRSARSYARPGQARLSSSTDGRQQSAPKVNRTPQTPQQSYTSNAAPISSIPPPPPPLPAPSTLSPPPMSAFPHVHISSSVERRPVSSAHFNYTAAPPPHSKNPAQPYAAHFGVPQHFLRTNRLLAGGPPPPPALSGIHVPGLEHDRHNPCPAEERPGTLVLTRAPDGAITNARLSTAPKKTRSGFITRSLL